MNKAIPFGRYFDDFEIGDVYHHEISKTITESDNNLFSLLTMNHHPVHINLDYANTQVHGRILVVGTLVFSLVVGITVADISGKSVANLDYEKISHLSPVFIGDTLYVKTTVLNKRFSKSNTSNGIVYVETIATNQNNIEVLSFRRNVLVKCRKNK
jgi:acyl dehydratase